jgi:hypothetical protein
LVKAEVTAVKEWKNVGVAAEVRREGEVLELNVVTMTTICCSGRTVSGLLESGQRYAPPIATSAAVPHIYGLSHLGHYLGGWRKAHQGIVPRNHIAEVDLGKNIDAQHQWRRGLKFRDLRVSRLTCASSLALWLNSDCFYTYVVDGDHSGGGAGKGLNAVQILHAALVRQCYPT